VHRDFQTLFMQIISVIFLLR